MEDESAKLPAEIKDSATLIWNVDGFNSFHDRICSPVIVTNKNRHQFVLHLDATNRLFDIEHVILALYYYSHERHLFVQYRVSILDVNLERQYTKEYRWDYHSSNTNYSNYNVTNYIPRERCKEFLSDLAFCTLKLLIEIDVFNRSPTCSPIYHNHFSFPSSKSPDFDFTFYLESGRLSDVVLAVGDKQFKAHKVILAAKSETFKSMFCDRDQDKAVHRVDFEEIHPEVMQKLLAFIYTGKIGEIDDKFSLELYTAADKFGLKNLKSICEQSLNSHHSLTIESAPSILLFADMHHNEELKAKCIEYIVENSEDIMSTDGWKQLVKSNKIELLAELFKELSSKSWGRDCKAPHNQSHLI